MRFGFSGKSDVVSVSSIWPGVTSVAASRSLVVIVGRQYAATKGGHHCDLFVYDNDRDALRAIVLLEPMAVESRAAARPGNGNAWSSGSEPPPLKLLRHVDMSSATGLSASWESPPWEPCHHPPGRESPPSEWDRWRDWIETERKRRPATPTVTPPSKRDRWRRWLGCSPRATDGCDSPTRRSRNGEACTPSATGSGSGAGPASTAAGATAVTACPSRAESPSTASASPPPLVHQDHSSEKPCAEGSPSRPDHSTPRAAKSVDFAPDVEGGAESTRSRCARRQPTESKDRSPSNASKRDASHRRTPAQLATEASPAALRPAQPTHPVLHAVLSDQGGAKPGTRI